MVSFNHSEFPNITACNKTIETIYNKTFTKRVMSDTLNLTVSGYELQIDSSKFEIKQKDQFIEATSRDDPKLKAIIFIEELPREMNRDDVFRDTVSKDPLGILHMMHLEEASITGIDTNLFVNCRPGFDVFSNTSKMSSYRISYWLGGEDAISIFSSSPNNDLKDKIITLAISIRAKKI